MSTIPAGLIGALLSFTSRTATGQTTDSNNPVSASGMNRLREA
jgi:hypothetical protein